MDEMPTRLNSTRLVSMMDLFVFHLPFVSVCLSVCQQSVCVQVYECASACVSVGLTKRVRGRDTTACITRQKQHGIKREREKGSRREGEKVRWAIGADLVSICSELVTIAEIVTI